MRSTSPDAARDVAATTGGRRPHPWRAPWVEGHIGDVLVFHGQRIDGIAEQLGKHQPARAALGGHSGRVHVLDHQLVDQATILPLVTQQPAEGLAQHLQVKVTLEGAGVAAGAHEALPDHVLG
jgi:hypothetical protein